MTWSMNRIVWLALSGPSTISVIAQRVATSIAASW